MRYATINPYSYVHANLGGQVTLLEVRSDLKRVVGLLYVEGFLVVMVSRPR